MLSRKNIRTMLVLAAAVTPVAAGLSSTTRAGTQTVISISGSTAIKNFLTAAGGGAYDLEPGTGGGNNSVTFGGVQYTANSTTGSILLTSLTGPTGTATYVGNNSSLGSGFPGIEVEYHGSGSVEGVQELLISQGNVSNTGVALNTGGYAYVPVTQFNPTSGQNTFINVTSTFTAGNTTSGVGYTLNNQTTFPVGSNPGSQAPATMIISDVPVNYTFSGNGSYWASNFSTAGQGNPAASTWAVPSYASNGTQTTTVAVPTGNATLAAGTTFVLAPNGNATTVSAGARYSLNTLPAGMSAGNFTQTAICAAGSTMVANPGTGLTGLSTADTAMLECASRLTNGLGFQMTTRDVGSGTRAIMAAATGVDVSEAVGVNDTGNGNNFGNATTTQINIGKGITFSNKTSGGSQELPVVEDARMAVGYLSLSDAYSQVGDASGTNTGNVNAPVRALYAGGAQGTGSATQINPTSLVNATWQYSQTEYMVTLKGTGAGGDSIAGDDSGNSTQTLENLFTNSSTDYPNFNTNKTPADTMVANHWLPLILVAGTNAYNTDPGGAGYQSGKFLTDTTEEKQFTVGNPSNITSGIQAGTYYGGGKSSTQTWNVLITAQDASGNALGVPGTSNGSTTATQANAVGGNWLFGNFKQNGVRDLSSVLAAGQALMEASIHYANTVTGTLDLNDSAVANNGSNWNGYTSAVYTNSNGSFTADPSALNNMNNNGTTSLGPTKGDLIVLGDYQAQGTFNGADLYQLATKVAASDAGTGNGNGNLTISGGAANFAANVVNAVLRKNTALDDFATMFSGGNATDTAILTSADSVKPYSPHTSAAIANAFNKFDVLGNGYSTTADKLKNAAAVDAAIGMSYGNLSQSIGTTVTVQGSTYPVSLTAAKLTDASANSATGAGNTTITRADFNLIVSNINSGSSTLLYKGDCNFDGSVGLADLSTLLQNYGSTTQKWSLGNFDQTTTVGLQDLTDLLQNYGHNSITGTVVFGDQALLADPAALSVLSADGFHVSPVPEPATLSLLTVGAVGFLARRRRRSN